MAQRRQGMSITLPRNFAYTSPDGVPPKTPDQTFSDLSLPAPPHHSSCRFRRPRLNELTSSATHDGTLPTLNASDIPIPSIEIAPSSDPFGPSRSDQLLSSSTPFDRFRLSARRDLQPPRTPSPQIPTTPTEPALHGGWDIKRPESSCSIRSDSSVSSDESFDSRPTSFGGSCTSPESDFQDPFCARGMNYLDSPTRPHRKMVPSRSDSSIATTSNNKTRWTPEMDAHLWNIYQMYLQDPTITPFKTVPGSLPPLGVCHRVAREAKRTWSRACKSQNVFSFSETPDLASPRSGSSTPTGPQERHRNFWPKESSTRRRLKELCKRKFSIAPHYQRLLQARSPSPFLESFVRRPASRSSTIPAAEDTSMTFATRDLGVSLMSTEINGPLARLATEPCQQPNSDDWFNTPVSSEKTVEMSVSPPQEQFVRAAALEPPSSVPRLASPFVYNTWGPTRSRRSQRPALNQFDTMHATGPHLLSPVRLDPFSNAHKRRAQNQLDHELSPGGSDSRKDLQNLFSPTSGSDVSQRRVRVRNRGFTLGAVDARERLDNLFTPPSDTPMSGIGGPSAGLAPPALGDDAKKLGSPFELDATKTFRSHNRTPRHAASTSEPFITNPFASSFAVSSIGERLAAFQPNQSASSGSTSQPLPLDPLEPGISDAERIRRQLLNRHHAG